jgi:hypothetical protein
MMTRLLAATAAALTVMVLSIAQTVAAQKSPVQCMTDDGYGRFRPCSALYKREHPNWRGSDQCMTDDGYGRYRPCDALYKQKHQK